MILAVVNFQIYLIVPYECSFESDRSLLLEVVVLLMEIMFKYIMHTLRIFAPSERNFALNKC